MAYTEPKGADYLNFEYGFKMIIVGDSAVGKSSMFRRYVKNLYRRDYDFTTCVDYDHVFEDVRGSRVKLTIWDTAGQERVHEYLFNMYYRHAATALIVYDITRRDTFEHVPRWLEMIQTHCPENVAIGLVGMKLDLTNIRQVTTKEGKAFASAHGLQFWETSAAHPDATLHKVFREPIRKALDRVRRRDFTREQLWSMGASVGKLHKKYRAFSTSVEESGIFTNLTTEDDRGLVEGERKSCAC